MSMGHLKINYIMIEKNCIVKEVNPTHSNFEFTLIRSNINSDHLNHSNIVDKKPDKGLRNSQCLQLLDLKLVYNR